MSHSSPRSAARVDQSVDSSIGDSKAVSRRAVTKGLVWSVPVVAAAAAVPMAVASTGCTPVSFTSQAAVFTRSSATSAMFTWVDALGDGRDLTLTFNAVYTGQNNPPNMAINTTSNLTLDTTQQGGEALPSLRLSLDTLTLANNGGGENVTFSFALGGAPVAVENLTYKIKDIDGFKAQDGNGGAERISITAGTGTIVNTAWVTGSGTGADRWRLSPQAPDTEVVPSSTAGNVNVTAPSVTAFTLAFIVNNSGRAGTDRPNQNIWIGPFAFSLTDPACTP